MRIHNIYIFQLYESPYEGFQDGKRDENGYFAIDQYSGKNTNFKVYFTNLVESYIKSISIESQDGNSFNTIMDSRMSLHYLSVYNAPFDKVGHICYQYLILTKWYFFSRSAMFVLHGSIVYPASPLSRYKTRTLCK